VRSIYFISIRLCTRFGRLRSSNAQATVVVEPTGHADVCVVEITARSGCQLPASQRSLGSGLAARADASADGHASAQQARHDEVEAEFGNLTSPTTSAVNTSPTSCGNFAGRARREPGEVLVATMTEAS